MPFLIGKRGNVKPSMAAGLVGIGAAYMMGSETGMFAAFGALSPHFYAAGVNSAGYEVAILPPEEGDTA